MVLHTTHGLARFAVALVVALFLFDLVVLDAFVSCLVFLVAAVVVDASVACLVATIQLLCTWSDMVRMSLVSMCVVLEFWSFTFDHELPLSLARVTRR